MSGVPEVVDSHFWKLRRGDPARRQARATRAMGYGVRHIARYSVVALFRRRALLEGRKSMNGHDRSPTPSRTSSSSPLPSTPRFARQCHRQGSFSSSSLASAILASHTILRCPSYHLALPLLISSPTVDRGGSVDLRLVDPRLPLRLQV
jgi:hypothetical protein